MSVIREVRSDQHTGICSVSSPIGKFSFDLAVWAPKYLSAGTSISPKLSVSILEASWPEIKKVFLLNILNSITPRSDREETSHYDNEIFST